MAIGSSHAGRSGVAALIGVSSSVSRGRDFSRRVAGHRRAVLLAGPTGTGKELIARIAHSLAADAAAPLVRFDGERSLTPFAESQLAGHVAGAIPIVRGASLGSIRAAAGGTLLVKNIEGLSLQLQERLVRLVEEGRVRPVGGSEDFAVDVRLVATSRVDLRERVAAGRFLPQLYEALQDESHRTLPLARRPGDVAVLAEAFLDDLSVRHGMPRVHLTSAALQMLMVQPWPGNVRQLRQVLEEAAIHSEHRQINAAQLGAAIDKAERLGGLPLNCPEDWSEGFANEIAASEKEEAIEQRPVFRRVDAQVPLDDWPTMADAERDHIVATLQRSRYDLQQTARLLGIDENELRTRLVQHAIELPEGEG